MGTVRSCVFVLLAAAPTTAQVSLAEDVTALLGGRGSSAWFEKNGTIWLHEADSRRTIDTGVAVAAHGEAGEQLVVYHRDRVQSIGAGGAVTTIPVPMAYDGFDARSSAPRLWRRLLSTSHVEAIELQRWSGAWQRSLAVVDADPDYDGICDVTVRSTRYLVNHEDYAGNSITDLLAGRSWPISWSGWIAHADCVPLPWSQGLVYRGERLGFGQEAAYWFRDDGIDGERILPGSWGWGPFDWSIVELEPGHPFVAQDQGPEMVALLTRDDRPFPRPAGALANLFVLGPTEEVLAVAARLGAQDLLHLDRASATWRLVAGGADLVAVHPAGAPGSGPLLAIQRRSGSSLEVFDTLTSSLTPLVTGLAELRTGVAALASGFLFAADDGRHGSELWFSDGTPGGTRLCAELLAGPGGSRPRDFVKLGESVVFVADGDLGARLWTIRPQHLDWTRDPRDGHFYRLTAPASWHAAEREASNAGGHLATIGDRTEQDWLWQRFGGQDLWIGLHDEDRDGRFEWTSGESVTFTNWCPGEPNGLARGETVVHLAHYQGSCIGAWNDQSALDRYPGIIERSSAPSEVEEFGSGCRSEPGQPVGRLRWSGGMPRPGAFVDLEIVLGSGYQLAGHLLLGWDATSIGTLRLPIELGILGAPGCWLHIRPDDAVAVGPVAYARPIRLQVPAQPSLIGSRLFVQGAGLELGSVSGTTNALRLSFLP